MFYSYRFTKRSHHGHSSKSNGPDQLMNNESDKDGCIRDLMLLHQTWLNITRKIENIRRNVNRLRQGFVTMSLSNKVQLQMNDIEKELSGILEAIIVQQKLTGYEYALGDIMKQVAIIYMRNNKYA